MTEERLKQLLEAGIDPDAGARRFLGNTALYERFLWKFLEDENMGRASAAMSAGRWEEALTAAHTLKGVAGNLSMLTLHEACARTVAALRAGDHAAAAAAMGEMERAYEAVCAALTERKEGEGP